MSSILGAFGALPGGLPTNTLALLALVLGFVVPLIVALVVQTHWSNTMKSVAALLVSVICSVSWLAFDGKLNGQSASQATIAVLGGAVWFYHYFWKNSGITDWIEQFTTIAPSLPNPPPENSTPTPSA